MSVSQIEIQGILYEDACCIEIGDGDCAQQIDAAAGNVSQGKHPDFGAYERQGVRGKSAQFTGDKRKRLRNRIPGDAKLFRKINRPMLPPDGELFRDSYQQAKHVLSQIHDYMDRHGARYGYIVTDEELIFFRRRGTGWGHMDISPPIRHDVEGSLEERIWISKAVLLYFHFVVANDEEQWHLPSCRRLLPTRKGPKRTVKTKSPDVVALQSKISPVKLAGSLTSIGAGSQLRQASANGLNKSQFPRLSNISASPHALKG